MNVGELNRQLKLILAEHEIVTEQASFLIEQRLRYKGNADLVVQPNSVEKIQALMRFCSVHHISVTPQGGNTGLCGGAVPDGGVLLNLSKLNRIREINLTDNTITVDAGMILQEVQNAAFQAGRLFPLSLASEGSCQIGGNIACNAGGLNVLRYGTMRDLVLGLEVVLANGELISHLHPLHKNTTGYDLRHLFIGSEGTLGIITAATLKLFAKPQTIETVWVGVETIEEAVALLTKTKNYFADRLCSFEIISQFSLQMSSQFSNIDAPIEAPWHILLELNDSMQRDDLGDLLVQFLLTNGFENAVLARSGSERQDLWTLRENISTAQRHLGASIKHDIALPIVFVSDFIERCEKSIRAQFQNIKIVIFGHLGDGSLHYNVFIPDVLDNDVYHFEDEINTIVYKEVLQHKGTIAAEHGIGKLKNKWLPWVRTDTEIGAMRAIKAFLDPNNILNVHKLLP